MYINVQGYAARIPPAFLDTLQNSLQDGDGVVEAIGAFASSRPSKAIFLIIVVLYAELDGTVTAFPESTPTNGA